MDNKIKRCKIESELSKCTIEGTLSNPTLRGYNAYQVAVHEGYTGTVEEWLESLKGTPGHTPIKGVDYFTPQEIAEMEEAISSGAIGDFNKNVEEKTDQFNTNATAKKNEITQYANTKMQEFNTNAQTKTGEFNQNANDKMSAFNTNANNKLTRYNENDLEKTRAYNANANVKLEAFNTNYNAKKYAFDQSAAEKTAEFDADYTAKKSAFDSNAEEKTVEFDGNFVAKTNAFNEFVRSSIETFDANASTKTASYNQNASEKLSEYNDNADSKIREFDERVELNKFPNVTIVGSPTISHGNISGFSASNYCRFPFMVDFKNKPFEITFDVVTGSNVTNQENILDSDFGLAFAIRSGHFVIAISTNGTSWDLGEGVGTLTVQPSTEYRIVIGWNGSVYTVKVSTDGGQTFATDIAKNGTVQPYPRQIFVGVGENFGVIANAFSGIINLNYASLYIDGQLAWLGIDVVGLATRLATDLSNIDEDGVEYLRNKYITMSANIFGLYIDEDGDLCQKENY